MDLNNYSSHISSQPDGKFLALQNNRVLGLFDSYEEACARCNDEIQRDRISLLLKRRLLKKFLKKHDSFITDYYIVAEVKNYEIPKLF